MRLTRGLRTALLIAPCLWTAASARADSAEPAVTLPIAIHSGHAYVDVMVDDQGPFHFVFDSGAVNVLSPQAARRLGLAVAGTITATGTGGRQTVGSAKVRSVRLGGVTLANQTFYVVDLPGGAAEDVPVDGLIGWEWLSRFPMRLDYAAATLTIFPGGVPAIEAGMTPIPFDFAGKRARIAGRIDGLAGTFTIDTGSSGSLTLGSPFVASQDLVARYHAHTRVLAAVGVGGPVHALIARADRLELGDPAHGGVTVTQPVIFMSQQSSGTSASKETAGNIGFGVLRKFTITFDYPRSRLFFQPNRLWAEPDLADRSGLRVERSGPGFRIAFVADQSPAAQAGLKEGDVILAVDGTPCAGMSGDAIKARFKGPVGAGLRLTLDGKAAEVLLTLAEL